MFTEQDIKALCDREYGAIITEMPNIKIACGMIYQDKLIWKEQKNMENESKLLRFHSVSKLYTAILCCIAREEGKLDFNKNVTNYIKDFSLFWREEDVSEEVTIERLLTNSSGLFHNARVGNNFFTCEERKKHVQSISGCELLFYPGTNYKYSNTGFNVLGFILESIYGKSYETLIKEKVFKPMGMEHAEFSKSNRSINPSTGLCVAFDDALIGLQEVMRDNSVIDALSKFDFVDTLYEIREKQVSGFGYGCKIFSCKESKFCVVTGSCLNEYVIQVWSKKNKLGMILYAQNEIPKLLELLEQHDMFWETFLHFQEEKEVEANGLVYGKEHEVKDNNFGDLEIKNYISMEGSFLYIIFWDDDHIGLSHNQKNWIVLTRQNKYFVNETHSIEFEENLNQFYLDSNTEFGTFYRNELEFALQEDDKTWYQNEFVLDVSEETNETNRKKMRIFNRLHKIYFTYENNKMYLNGKVSLKRLDRTLETSILKTPYGEKIIVNKDFIIVENVKYITKKKER